jgi:hypothetical protein
MSEIIKVIATIFVSSSIAALIVGYFFNRKLEERKMLLKINEQFLSSLITGLNLLMNSYKAFVSQAEEIKHQIERGNLTDESVHTLNELKDNYHATLKTHRVYLTALIPYGKTQEFDFSFDDINMVAGRYLLEILTLMTHINGEGLERYKNWSLEAIHYVNVSYESVCNKANTIIGYLHEKKNPLTIRWKDVNSESWDTIAERMFERFFSLDVEDKPEPPLAVKVGDP